MNVEQSTHSIIRTSPKGEGFEFIGKCSLCGTENLTPANVFEICDNPSKLLFEQVIIDIIDKD
jgi:hypothetical protein